MATPARPLRATPSSRGVSTRLRRPRAGVAASSGAPVTHAGSVVRRSGLGALLVGALASAALLGGAPVASADTVCADIDATPAAIGADRSEAAIDCLVNHERRAAGLGTLTVQPQVRAAAEAYATLMAVQDFFSHTGPDGSDPGSRITAQGFAWSAYGENIASGQETPREVMTAWLASEGHCENLMTPWFTVAGYGVAVVDDQPYWVQDFGRAVSSGSPNTSASQPSCPRTPTPFDGVATAATPAPAPAAPATTTPAAPAKAAKPAITATRRSGQRLRVSVALPSSRGRMTVRVKVKQAGRTVRTTSMRLAGGKTLRLTVKLPVARRGTVVVRAGSGRWVGASFR